MATSTPTMKTEAVTVAVAAGLGVAVVKVTGEENIQSTVDAVVDSATLTAQQGDLLVRARTTANANPDVVGVAVAGGLTVNVIDFTSNIGGSSNAFVTGTTSILSGNRIDIEAVDTNSSTPNISQVNVGLLTVGRLIRYLASVFPTEVVNLPPKPSQVTSDVEGA